MKILTPWRVAVILSVLIISGVTVYAVSNIKHKTENFKRRPLRRMDDLGGTASIRASSASTSASVVTSTKSGATTKQFKPALITGVDAVNQFRPYNPEAPEDYYGVFTVSASKSATLVIDKGPEYFEVVVYSFPDWKVVYAETNVPLIHMDFLPHGDYATVIFSIGDDSNTSGFLEISRNSKRDKPASKSHRMTSKNVAKTRNDCISRIAKSAAPADASEYMCVGSSPVFMWPGSIYTRVEQITVPVPTDSLGIIVAIPSYAYIVSGADEYLGNIVHEANSIVVYKASPKFSEMTEVHGDDDDFDVVSNGNNSTISLTVVYPDIDPESPEPISPPTEAYVY